MAQRKDGEIVFAKGITHWWKAKSRNASTTGKSQGGTRDHNLRGDTMDGFRDVIIDHLCKEGVAREDIFCGSQFAKNASNLPSYFRASKNWDVVVCKHAHHLSMAMASPVPPVLIAAIEFKSQDKSIGNNQNNRIEESIGNAHDFWASYENGNFGRLSLRPWLGYLLVGRYGAGDENRPVEIRQPLFPTDPAFCMDPERRFASIKLPGVSYAERYRLFLERMIAMKLYDSAAFLVTSVDIASETPNYRVLYPQLSGEQFLDSLKRHVSAYYFEY